VLDEKSRKAQLIQYLAASTITDDNKFPANVSHDVRGLVKVFRRDKNAVVVVVGGGDEGGLSSGT
jgi:hypothetical protein